MNINTLTIVGVVVVCCLLTEVRGQTSTDAKNLRKQVFVTNDYDKKIRPTTSHTDATEVWVSFYLLTINDLDEVTETLKTTGYLYIEWFDQFLTWTPSDYGGIEYYHWPQDDIWKPDVALKNSYLEYKQLGVATLNVQVHSDGSVQWSPFQVFQSTCSVDITYFPFDTQTCKLKFVAWSYTTAEVVMQGGTTGIDLTFYETNSEWDIVNTKQTVEQESGEASIIYTINMQRKPRYHILTLLLPIIMLTVLNLFTFVLPCSCGEKASYAVTVFLAFAVFLTIIATSLPESSDSTAIFSTYILIQTLQSTLITLTALVLIRVDSFNESKPIPMCLVAMLRCVACIRCGKRKSTAKLETFKVVPETTPNDKTRITTVDAEPAEDGAKTRYTWREAVNMLDWLCFVVFSIIAVISTAICLLVSAYGQ